MKLLLAGMAIIIFAISTPASAAQIFLNEAAFLENMLPDFYLEDFSNFTPGPQPNGLLFSKNNYSYQLAATPVSTLYSLDGSMSTNASSDAIKISFTGSKPVTAIGGRFWPTDSVGDNATGQMNIELSDGTQLLNFPSDSETFRGFTTSGQGFTWMLVSCVEGSLEFPKSLWPTLDHFYVGSQVPLPGAFFLLGAGLLRLARFARQRQA